MYPKNTSPSVERPNRSYQANGDHEGGDFRDIADLRNEFALFKAELASLKKITGGLSKIQEEFSRLKKETAALRERIGGDSDANGDHRSLNSANDDSLDASQRTEEGPIAAGHEQADKDYERMQIINNVFSAEPTDRQWSAETNNLVKQFFEDVEPLQVDLSDVECRSTLCRVEVNYKDAAADEFALRFPMHVGKALPNITYHYEQHDDGHTSVVMYLAKEGYQLPDVTQ
ncbi:MAG: hypothetical protein ACREU9_01710 [Gammaproteobacteria bacterium]